MAKSFNSSQHAYGGGFGRYLICKVVNRDDPEQSGRLQVRVIGYQDNEGTIPDEQLFWARSMGSMDNPLDGGIGKSITGAREGSHFIGFFSDAGNQQLMLQGSIGKAGEGEDGEDLDQSGRKHDTPKQARDDRAEGGDVRFDAEKQEYADKSIWEYARDEAVAPDEKRKKSKNAEPEEDKSFSIGMKPYELEI